MSDQNKNTEVHDLGVAGRMAGAFIHSPLSPLLLLACLAMGVIGLIMTPRQEDPQISVPMVDVLIQYPGASSVQVASLVTDPLERIMSEIPGVKHVYSASRREGALVTVEFDVGQNMEESLVKLYNKLMSNMDKVPPGVSEPLVKPKGVDDVPVVTLTLWSKDLDDAALRLLALDVRQKLKEVSNTSESFIVGGRAEQIRVEGKPERLAGFGITLDQLAETVRTANSERGVGRVEGWDSSFKLYTGAFLKGAQDVSRLVVGVRNDAPIYIRDVADVFHGPEETKQVVTYDSGPSYADDTPAARGESSVTLAVAKKPGTNGVTVANDILARVETLKGELIPDNVYVAVTRNYGETANDKVNELIFKLFIATAIVTALVWLFLGMRAALVVLIVIPVVILVTVFAAWLSNYTIDRVSLFALIFSIGILVDDAIVVVENMYRRWLMKGESDTETSVDAVREVGNPTILATFTVIAALRPMGMVSGMMGPYMLPIPALGSVAMMFSLFAAFVFTPWLVMRLKPSLRYLSKAEEKEHRSIERLDKVYRKSLLPLIHSRTKGYLFLAAIVIVFFLCCALFYTTSVAVKMLPLDNKPEFNVTLDMPDGTALPATVNLARRLAAKLRAIEEVTALQTYVGTASPFNFNGLVRHYYMREEPWLADIQVQLLHKNDRERTSHEIALEARELVTPIAREMGARVAVVEMPPGPPVLQSIVAEIYGPSPEVRRQVAADMTQIFEQAETVTDVDNMMLTPYEVWQFRVDTEKAVRRGVTVDVINRNLEMAMGGFVLGDIKLGDVLEPTNIVLQVPMANRTEFARLGNLLVPNSDGEVVPLAELGRFVEGVQDPVIYHKDLRDVEFVTGEVIGRLAAPIYGMLEIQKLLDEYKTPDGVAMSGEYLGPPKTSGRSGFEWTGEWTVTYETFRDMGIAFGVAIILIYMLVVWEFGNFTLPAIIMAPIPLTLIGIIPGHWLMDAEFTATSMIGFIALAGIIVRNSILLVDFARQEMRKGTDVVEAVIMACKARTRPIVITAAALMGGSFVILTDPIFEGMAVSLFFGVFVSTLLTLLIIPLGCISGRKAFGISKSASPEGVAVAVGGPAVVMASGGDTASPSRLASVMGVLGIYLKLIGMGLLALPKKIFGWLVSPMLAPLRNKFRKPVTVPPQSEPISTAPSVGEPRPSGSVVVLADAVARTSDTQVTPSAAKPPVAAAESGEGTEAHPGSEPLTEAPPPKKIRAKPVGVKGEKKTSRKSALAASATGSGIRGGAQGRSKASPEARSSAAMAVTGQNPAGEDSIPGNEQTGNEPAGNEQVLAEGAGSDAPSLDEPTNIAPSRAKSTSMNDSEGDAGAPQKRRPSDKGSRRGIRLKTDLDE